MKDTKFISYSSGIGENKNWIIKENEFNIFNQQKFEPIMTLGNGYIGSRAIHEEKYTERHSGLYIAGTFNTVEGPEVSELPNCANPWDFTITINDEEFNLTQGEILSYERTFNLRYGEQIRKVRWLSPNNHEIEIISKKFISMSNLHLLVQKIILKAKEDLKISIHAGIDGQETNSGAQHFEDTDATYFDNIMEYVFTTTKSKIAFVYNKAINFYFDGNKEEQFSRLSSVYGYDRRQLKQFVKFDLLANKKVAIELFTTINTTRDIEYFENEIVEKDLRANAHKNMQEQVLKTYDQELEASIGAWNNWWKDNEIKIESTDDFDILAVRFHQYHIRRFTPMHDWRTNIEAKGFSGEEYKGHTFWDTEIFIWPYFLYTDPNEARNLLKHRFFVKNSAIIKAKENGYDGLWWPWETTWPDQGETCPTWGAVDRKEGKRIKVWPAFNQLHICSDITWAIWQYYSTTNDYSYMKNYGFELFFETARFWISRLEWNESIQKYEITLVTGPNEYKENINNNAFTNYMLWFNIDKSISYIKELKISDKDLFEKLNAKLNLENLEEELTNIVDKIYLPKPNEKGIIPENDTFLKLPEVDMKFYKAHPSQLFNDYTFPEINGYQVLKQADIITLFYTLGHLFDEETIEKNWRFYESRCMHDSSLSLSMHTITANYAKDKSFAYDFFKKASAIDLGNEMVSSLNGIHSASIGGTLQSIISGFGGLKNANGNYIFTPNLPKAWDKLEFNVYLLGQKILITLTKDYYKLKKVDQTNELEIPLIYNKKTYILKDEIIINHY